MAGRCKPSRFSKSKPNMKYVEIQGKKMPAQFNMDAFLELEQQCGLTMAEILGVVENSPAILMRSFYLALKYGADASHKRFDMTYSDFVEVANDDDELQTSLSEILISDFKVLVEKINKKRDTNVPSDQPEEEKKVKPSGTTTPE